MAADIFRNTQLETITCLAPRHEEGDLERLKAERPAVVPGDTHLSQSAIGGQTLLIFGSVCRAQVKEGVARDRVLRSAADRA